MNISPQTNLSSPVSNDQKTIFADSSAGRSSSKDVAAVSTNAPSVRVSLSVSENAVAAANAKVPPLYSRPNTAESNQTRFRTDEARQEENSARPEDLSDSSDTVERRGDSSKDEELKQESRRKDSSEEQAGSTKLTDEELEVVEQLKLRDKEVRAHEQAHKAVGGQYTGAISFEYQSGPDGKRYAVGGEVPIDVSKIPDNPEATISKMQTVKAAATAPAEPSQQDRAVAAEASRILAEAQSDLAEMQREELQEAKERAAERTEEQDDTESTPTNSSAVDSFQEIAALDQEIVPEVDTLI